MITEMGRIYPIKDKVKVQELKLRFAAKNANNRASGYEAAIKGNGKFEGFKRTDMDNLFVMEIEPTEASRAEFASRVVKPLKELAEKLGILDKMVFTDEGDQAAHITAHVGKFTGTTTEEKEAALAWLKGNDSKILHSHLSEVGEILAGTHVTLDEVVCSGRDTYTGASQVNGDQGAIFRARSVFDRAMKLAQVKLVKVNPNAKVGVHYPRYDDIVHVSSARFTAKVDRQTMLAWIEGVNKLDAELKANPVRVEINKVNFLIATEGIEKRKPDLLK